MYPEFDADGETWRVSLEHRETHPGVRAVVFHCISNEQRAYHVVEVPADRFDTDARLAELADEDLADLFGQSEPMDVSHDPKANPDAVDTGPLPRSERP